MPHNKQITKPVSKTINEQDMIIGIVFNKKVIGKCDVFLRLAAKRKLWGKIYKQRRIK